MSEPRETSNESGQDIVVLPTAWDAQHPWMTGCFALACSLLFVLGALTHGLRWWGWPAAVVMVASLLSITWMQGGATRCELHPDAVVVRHRRRPDERYPLAGIERVVTCRPPVSAAVLRFRDGSGVRLPVAPGDRWGTPTPKLIARWLELHGHPSTHPVERVRIAGDWPYWAAMALAQASIIWVLTSFGTHAGWSYGASWSLMAAVFFLGRVIPDLRGRRIAHDWTAHPEGTTARVLLVDEQ